MPWKIALPIMLGWVILTRLCFILIPIDHSYKGGEGEMQDAKLNFWIVILPPTLFFLVNSWLHMTLKQRMVLLLIVGVLLLPWVLQVLRAVIMRLVYPPKKLALLAIKRAGPYETFHDHFVREEMAKGDEGKVRGGEGKTGGDEGKAGDIEKTVEREHFAQARYLCELLRFMKKRIGNVTKFPAISRQDAYLGAMMDACREVFPDLEDWEHIGILLMLDFREGKSMTVNMFWKQGDFYVSKGRRVAKR